MTYNQFIEAVVEKVKESVEDNIRVHIHTAVKNNGKVRKGIAIAEEGINISPTIYLEEYYQEFLSGGSLEDITGDLLELYAKVRFRHSFKGDYIKDYTKVKEKIIYHLINRRANEELLKEVPYIPYLDLAIVFYIVMDVNRFGTATMLIKEEQMEEWRVTAEQIYECACENTEKLLPCEFLSVHAAVNKITGREEADSEADMFVLSNCNRSFGAAAILYKDRLKKVGERLGENYYVLPSSVHEVIIVPRKAAPGQKDLTAIVREMNQTEVEEEEILSDNVYYYDRKTDKLSL